MSSFFKKFDMWRYVSDKETTIAPTENLFRYIKQISRGHFHLQRTRQYQVELVKNF